MATNTWAKGNIGGQAEIGKGKGGSGGGGGDLSTAKITFTVDPGVSYFEAYSSMAFEAGSEENPAHAGTSVTYNEAGTYVCDVILYKGRAFFSYDSDGKVTAAGNIKEIGEMMYHISGDCQITVSAVED